MAGHSQFKNIMHRKGRQDAAQVEDVFQARARNHRRGQNRARPIPTMNPRLRLAVQNAKAASMPKDNIQRAINKASGGDAENYEEVRYEGYGPGGVAVIVEALTDNRNRSASNVRAAFTKAGGALGETGSVSFMWDRVGEIFYPAEGGRRRQGDGGGDRGRRRRCRSPDEEGHTIYCAPSRISARCRRRWKPRSAKPNR